MTQNVAEKLAFRVGKAIGRQDCVKVSLSPDETEYEVVVNMKDFRFVITNKYGWTRMKALMRHVTTPQETP